MERTLSIIKPDAVKKNLIGTILMRFEQANLKIVAARLVHLSKEQARKFYAIHMGKPFYGQLVEFISSGPIMVQVLEGHRAISKNRELMGATNPKEALKGTIRADFAESIDQNAVHGSDSVDTAKEEINFFFTPEEIHS